MFHVLQLRQTVDRVGLLIWQLLS